MKTTQPMKDNYRIIPSKCYVNFEGIDIDKLRLIGYVQGMRVDSCKTLTLSNFDSISFVKTSENAINKKQYIHAIGLLKKQTYFLILER